MVDTLHAWNGNVDMFDELERPCTAPDWESICLQKVFFLVLKSNEFEYNKRLKNFLCRALHCVHTRLKALYFTVSKMFFSANEIKNESP